MGKALKDVRLNPELHKRLKLRQSDLKRDYDEMEGVFRELQEHIQPRRGRFDLGDKRTESRLNKTIIDNTSREALKTFRSGMMAGMTPPSRKWFSLSLMLTKGEMSHAVKQWLHEVTDRCHTVMGISNVYHMLPRAYEDLGLFGTHASFVLPDFDNIVHTMSLPMGEYYLGQDDKMRVDSLHRVIRRTVDQVVRRYGMDAVSDRVKEAYRGGRLSESVDIAIAIEPRRERDPLSKLVTQAPVMQAAWEVNGHEGKFLEVSGFQKKPYLCARWDIEAPDVWGFSPAMDAFGDAATLQQNHVEKAVAIKKSHNPPLMASVAHRRGRTKNFPGGITHLSDSDLGKGGYRPLYEVRPDISGLIEDIHDVRERIREAFFADLFQMFTHLDRRQITAEEIIRRHEEKVLMLGPMLERLQKELLEPLVELVFHYLSKADLIPPPPPELEVGQPLKVEYTSMLAQAQKAVGIQTMERAIGFVGTLAQIKPEALDKLDADEMVNDFWDISGADPRQLLDDDQVSGIREQRAAAEQEAAMMEAAVPMANASKLLSEANERGEAV